MTVRVALALALLPAFVAGCARTVLIDSEPPGAVVRVNGQPRGTTPLRTKLPYTAFSTFEVTLEKEGYRPATSRLPMELNPASLVCGVACPPVLLWVQEPANTVFVLEREYAPPVPEPATSPVATPPPAQ